MFEDLKGKTVLITGASSGIGAGIALGLAQYGCRLILCARRADKLEALCRKIGDTAQFRVMDVTRQQDVNDAFSDFDRRGEAVDVCINCAGIGGFTPVLGVEDDGAFERIMQTNVMGVWYVTRAAANHMKEKNLPGSIIIIGSINGTRKLSSNLAAYATSKAAVGHLAQALVGELSPHDIRINCIHPGLFETPMTQERLDDPPTRHKMEAIVPLGFIPGPEDILGAVLLLASNRASRYMTGSILTVDGGTSWGGA